MKHNSSLSNRVPDGFSRGVVPKFGYGCFLIRIARCASTQYIPGSRRMTGLLKTAVIATALVATALVVTAGAPLRAQDRGSREYRGTPAQQAACRPNVFRFCAAEIPNVRRITACLRANIHRLSPDCAAAIAENSR
jgi:hypothetical protein